MFIALIENYTMEEKMNITIGSRALGAKEREKILPTINDLVSQIDNFCAISDERESNNFDNVFSVLGARGSGKSSILHSIRSIVEENKNIDSINLPIIQPSELLANESPIGWIISALSEIVAEMENCYKKSEETKPSSMCTRQLKSELMSSFDSLIEQYEKNKERYEEIIQSQYRGKPEYINDQKERISTNSAIRVSFDKFINNLVNARRDERYMGEKVIKDDKVKSMVFIYFDDFDLEPKRCVSVLRLIETFLKNSKVLVFVAGDYNQFVDNITISLLKDDNILDYNLMKINYRDFGKFENMDTNINENINNNSRKL